MISFCDLKKKECVEWLFSPFNCYCSLELCATRRVDHKLIISHYYYWQLSGNAREDLVKTVIVEELV